MTGLNMSFLLDNLPSVDILINIYHGRVDTCAQATVLGDTVPGVGHMVTHCQEWVIRCLLGHMVCHGSYGVSWVIWDLFPTNDLQTPPPLPSVLIRFLRMLRNVLYRMKNEINFFPNLIFEL